MIRVPCVLRRTMLSLVIAVPSFGWGTPAFAQNEAIPRPLVFGLGLGATASPGLGIGSGAIATLEIGTPWRHLDARLDGSLTAWRGASQARVTSLTGNLVYWQRIGIIRPYLIGGVGGYAERGRGSSLGFNAGVGAKAEYGWFKPFAEIREHVWSADRTRRMTPVTFGVSF